MILNVVVDDQTFPVTVPDFIVAEGEEFFSKLDSDMDGGWQMSRDWVDRPNQEQRCQIVGDKMLTAMDHDNKRLMIMLCAYILARVPGVTGIRIDTHGEMQGTELVMEPGSSG
ncbi:MAG: hypothetical protein R3308_11210 [Thiohalobacterales bacterium]|nr:hypothetical protein [Thiohalobacterales bacterium]